MTPFTEEQVKSVVPWGVFRWTEPHPGRREGWCIITSELSAARAATVGEGEYLTPEQVHSRLQVEPRECGTCKGKGHTGIREGDLPDGPRIPCLSCNGTGKLDQHKELRALVEAARCKTSTGGERGPGPMSAWPETQPATLLPPPQLREIVLEVVGEPVPWAKPYKPQKGGTIIKDSQVHQMGEIRDRWERSGQEPFSAEMPLMLSVSFLVQRRKGHYGTGRNARLLKPGAPVRPIKRPDLSNCLKLVEDALVYYAFPDDDQIVGYYPPLEKRWVELWEPPRTIVRVRPWTPADEAFKPNPLYPKEAHL